MSVLPELEDVVQQYKDAESSSFQSETSDPKNEVTPPANVLPSHMHPHLALVQRPADQSRNGRYPYTLIVNPEYLRVLEHWRRKNWPWTQDSTEFFEACERREKALWKPFFPKDTDPESISPADLVFLNSLTFQLLYHVSSNQGCICVRLRLTIMESQLLASFARDWNSKSKEQGSKTDLRISVPINDASGLAPSWNKVTARKDLRDPGKLAVFLSKAATSRN